MTAKVLIVDDEPDVEPLFRQQLRREVKQGHYELDFAFSAEEALVSIDSDDPPEFMVVMSDVNMPGMSGIELVSKARPRRPDILYSIITAYGDDDTRSRARSAGAEEFFTKPVDFAKVRDFLSKAIEA